MLSYSVIWSRLETFTNDKCSSLLRKSKIYGQKKFYNLDSRPKEETITEARSGFRFEPFLPWPGNPHWRERISTVDLLVPTSSDLLLLMIKKYVLLFYETSYLNEEVNRAELSLSVSVPCLAMCPNLPCQFFSLKVTRTTHCMTIW